ALRNAGLVEVSDEDVRDFDGRADAGEQELPVVAQQAQDAAADGSAPEQGNAHAFSAVLAHGVAGDLSGSACAVKGFPGAPGSTGSACSRSARLGRTRANRLRFGAEAISETQARTRGRPELPATSVGMPVTGSASNTKNEW